MGRVALCGTGRIRYSGFVVMAELGDGFGIAVRTLGAGIGFYTVRCAGRFGSDLACIAMTCCIYIGVLVAVGAT